jgi:ATP-dependent Clp protease ATP-binding subunit ClpB
MTSNIGSDLLLQKIEERNEGWTKQELLALLTPILRKTFRPEFLNRINEILPFVPLQLDQLEKIVALQLDRVADRLKDRQISLKWDPSVVIHLAKEGYDPAFGARPLKRIIQQEVVNLFSSAILENKIPSHCELFLTVSKKEDEYSLHYEVKNK